MCPYILSILFCHPQHWPTVAAILALVLLPRQLRLTECIDLCKCLQGQLSSPSRGHQQQLLPVMLGRLLCTWCEVEILAQCVRDQQPSSGMETTIRACHLPLK